MSLLALLYGLILTFGFSASFVLAHAVLSAPLVPQSRLGIRGLKRARALQSSALFADVEPALRGSGMQVRRALGEPALAATDHRLMLAGDFLGLRPEEFIALCGLGAAVGAVFGAGYAFLGEHDMVCALVGAGFGALLPYSRLSATLEQRRERVEHGLPPIIDLLVLGLSAGLDLPGAVRQVVQMSSNPSDPLIEELGFVLHELHVGKTRKAALTQLGERLPTEAVREFTGAVIQAEEHGNPLARVLSIHAEASRRQRSTLAEERAAKAGAKLLMPMVMMFLAIMILILAPVILAASDSF